MTEINELRRDSAALMVNEWSPEAAKRNFSRSRSTSKGRRTDYAPTEPDEPTA